MIRLGDDVDRFLRTVLETTADCIALRQLPHGFDLCFDIARRQIDVKVIVDVGANIGQTAERFARVWPDSRIYCIEPFLETYRRLKSNTERTPRITPVQCALGSKRGMLTAASSPGNVNNSLVTAPPNPMQSASPAETIQVRTLDDFCEEYDIPHIDLLKIDTEGYDLAVLEGATGLLDAERISFVQVEAGMNPFNHKHVPLAALQGFLEERSYVLFGLYEQTPEWTGEARLRFANAVFISRSLTERPPGEASLQVARRSRER